MNNGTRLAVGAGLLIAVVCAIWAAVDAFSGDGGGVAIIQADNSAYKSKPAEEGGMEIPHQDKMVFSLGAGNKVAGTEKIAPPPEQPELQPVSSETAPQPAPEVVETAAATPNPPQAGTPINMAAEPVAPAAQPAPTKVAELAPSPAPTADAPKTAALGNAIEPVKSVPAAVVESKPAANAFDVSGKQIDAPTPVKKAEPLAAKPTEELKNSKPKQVQKSAKQLVASAHQTDVAPDEIFQEDNAVPQNTRSQQQPSKEEKSDQKSEDDSDVQDDSSLDGPNMAIEPMTKSAKGGSRFQLASFNDRASAERALSSFSKKYKGALGGSGLSVVEGTAHGRTVYRIQGRGNVCGAVKAQGGSCVTIK